jgi:uncharacterized short protein YbdD (DUF466 family)
MKCRPALVDGYMMTSRRFARERERRKWGGGIVRETTVLEGDVIET